MEKQDDGAVVWRAHTLSLDDLDLAWYEAGAGPTVVWLNGGPGDDHQYLRPVAAPLTSHLRCVLYDQRGCGRSLLAREDEETVSVPHFIADLDALRQALGQEKVALVGHSWGATLALLYAAAHPEHVKALALVGLGPLDDAMDAVARVNRLKGVTAAERDELAALPARRARLQKEGDHAGVQQVRRRQMALGTRAWFASPSAADRFLDDYMALPGPNDVVHRLVNASYRRTRPALDYSPIAAPVLIPYGYQDFEPITQAYTLRDHMPRADTRIVFLNECGHVPWLEGRDDFYHEIASFLTAVV